MFLNYYPFNGLLENIKIVQACRTGSFGFMLMFKILNVFISYFYPHMK